MLPLQGSAIKPVVALDIDGRKGNKTNFPSYNGRHWRVRDKRGSASNYKCIDCGNQAEHWSQIRGSSGDDPSNYEARCRSCHNKYDWDTNNFTKLTPEEVIEIREMYETGKYFQRELAELFEVTQSTVSSIVNKHTWIGVS